MSSNTHVHDLTSAAYAPVFPAYGGVNDWVDLRGNGIEICIDIKTADFARKLETAARECAEAIEAREAERVDATVEAAVEAMP